MFLAIYKCCELLIIIGCAAFARVGFGVTGKLECEKDRCIAVGSGMAITWAISPLELPFLNYLSLSEQQDQNACDHRQAR